MPTHSELVQFLRGHSYWETVPAHNPGDFQILGDTVIVWPVNATAPYRFHFFGEELEKVEKSDKHGWQKIETVPELWPNEIPTEHGTLHPGEYVVHPYHGVGMFERIETRFLQEEGDQSFACLLYAGNDRLLFPLTRQGELMPYIGSRHPRLTRLYSKSWQHTKERVQKDLIKIARELLKIYASRQLTERLPYPFNPEWERRVIEGIDFDLTEDQNRAMKEIYAELAGTVPMDRLVCGDVGYGKTEVALRTAAQVLAAGKQVALIAPTTVLAEQHFAVLRQRLAPLPVTVEHLSRLTKNREKEVIAGVTAGSIDIVIGTHRLLGKDVVFKDLGLLILDEEQKLGVAQKERLKEIRPHLDVISLSATPIPRTLSLSLSGLRGLSILRTAPHGRQPVKTVVGPYQDQMFAAALKREMERAGQVYVVHNRVQSLASVENKVVELLKAEGYTPVLYRDNKGEVSPKNKEVAVGMAHGQMGETELAATMATFLEGKIQVLVASSIVEHGLDSPLANTLVVTHSEWFGLSDLYQLRGRVGRRSLQAYAYFFLFGVERSGYTPDEEKVVVTENARRRLEALQEADTLGSGWSIAMRDLEIRGGGNILGHEQHGNMETIGLLLYAQLLQEEIGRQAVKLNISIFQKEKK
ncbi:DEAD/DEAH box helicase [Patescibacteria group bacterium]|nr:DEAD/DEAH box helicase [Patescibacteria group bacterium]